MIESTSSPSPWKQGARLKVPTLYSWLVSLATSLHSQVLSQSHLINITPVVVERHLLWITGHVFRLYGPEAISGTEDKRLNVTTKDAPIALIAKDIPRVWGAVIQEPQRKTKYMANIFGHLNNQIYVAYESPLCTLTTEWLRGPGAQTGPHREVNRLPVQPL